MKNLENAYGYYQRNYHRPHEDNDPSKPPLYWDGYQWVIRPNNNNFNNLVEEPIKPGRQVQIANVPLHLNLDVNLFKTFLIEKMYEKNVVSRKEVKKGNNLIKAIEFKKNNNTAILIMDNVDLAKQMILMDGIVLLGYTLRFSLYKEIKKDDVNLNNINKEMALANSAHISAKSAAISFAAFQSIFNKDNNNKNKEIVLNEDNDNNNRKINVLNSKIIKIMNICDSNKKDLNYKELIEDMLEEFSKFGEINSSLIIKKGKEKLGAEVGSVFIEYKDPHSAEIAIDNMKNKKYDNREISVVLIDELVYKNEILESK